MDEWAAYAPATAEDVEQQIEFLTDMLALVRCGCAEVGRDAAGQLRYRVTPAGDKAISHLA